MSRTLEIDQGTDVAATGVVQLPVLSGSVGGTRVKIPTRGHFNFTMTTIAKTASGSPSLIVQLKGTNNPDDADTAGEVLITNTHAAADTQNGSAANKAYKYVFVNITTATTLVLDRVLILGSGFAGLH